MGRPPDIRPVLRETSIYTSTIMDDQPKKVSRKKKKVAFKKNPIEPPRKTRKSATDNKSVPETNIVSESKKTTSILKKEIKRDTANENDTQFETENLGQKHSLERYSDTREICPHHHDCTRPKKTKKTSSIFDYFCGGLAKQLQNCKNCLCCLSAQTSEESPPTSVTVNKTANPRTRNSRRSREVEGLPPKNEELVMDSTGKPLADLSKVAPKKKKGCCSWLSRILGKSKNHVKPSKKQPAAETKVASGSAMYSIEIQPETIKRDTRLKTETLSQKDSTNQHRDKNQHGPRHSTRRKRHNQNNLIVNFFGSWFPCMFGDSMAIQPRKCKNCMSCQSGKTSRELPPTSATVKKTANLRRSREVESLPPKNEEPVMDSIENPPDVRSEIAPKKTKRCCKWLSWILGKSKNPVKTTKKQSVKEKKNASGSAKNYSEIQPKKIKRGSAKLGNATETLGQKRSSTCCRHHRRTRRSHYCPKHCPKSVRWAQFIAPCLFPKVPDKRISISGTENTPTSSDDKRRKPGQKNGDLKLDKRMVSGGRPKDNSVVKMKKIQNKTKKEEREIGNTTEKQPLSVEERNRISAKETTKMNSGCPADHSKTEAKKPSCQKDDKLKVDGRMVSDDRPKDKSADKMKKMRSKTENKEPIFDKTTKKQPLSLEERHRISAKETTKMNSGRPADHPKTIELDLVTKKRRTHSRKHCRKCRHLGQSTENNTISPTIGSWLLPSLFGDGTATQHCCKCRHLRQSTENNTILQTIGSWLVPGLFGDGGTTTQQQNCKHNTRKTSRELPKSVTINDNTRKRRLPRKQRVESPSPKNGKPVTGSNKEIPNEFVQRLKTLTPEQKKIIATFLDL